MSREGGRSWPLEGPSPVQEHAESREAVLQRGIDAFHAYYEASHHTDRVQALVTEYFFRSVLADRARPLVDVAIVLQKKLLLPGVSEPLKQLMSRVIAECLATSSPADRRIVLPPVPLESMFEERADESAAEKTPPSGVAAVPAVQPHHAIRRAGRPGDVMSLRAKEHSYGPDDDIRALNAAALQERRDAAREQKREYFLRAFSTARSLARRAIDRTVPPEVDATFLAQRIGDHAHTLIDLETELYDRFGFPAASIRVPLRGDFFVEYFAAAERAGDEANEFDHKVNEYIAIRARIGELLIRETLVSRVAAPATPRQVLGVKDDATAEAIEEQYLLRLQTLDPNDPKDQESIALLHQARLALPGVIDTSTASHAKTLNAPEAAAPTDSEGFLSRTFRAPGKMLRTLFGIAALGGVGITVHQFAENDSDEPRMTEAVLEEDPGVGQSGFESRLAEAEAQSVVASERVMEKKTSVNEIVLERGDSVWKIVIEMLRNRGLSTSNAQVQYFTHQALVDNGWTALSALEKKPGEKLDVTNIARLMDAAATGNDVVAVMEQTPIPVSVPSAAEPSVSGAQEVPSVFGYGSGNSQDWRPDFVVGTPQSEAFEMPITAEKPYTELPSANRAEHEMVKGESIYKLVHTMLRSRGLNWTTERINFLTQLVVDKNADRFREMVADGRMRKMDDVWIPAGAILDFSDAVAVVDEMERAKQAGKKAKTVRELALAKGYKYPIVMKFPKV